MQEYFKAAILGIVQGITEFLPISSTAHLRIFPALMRWEDPGTAYSAVIQLGSMLAVIIYFWSDLIRIYGALLGDFLLWVKGKVSSPLQSHDSKLGFWILIGTLPICVFGVLFKEPIEVGIVRDLKIIAFYLVFFGILLFLSERVARQNRILAEINALDVLLIGLAQAFALIPGVSRSGVTLFAGLLLGFKRAQAARFSFLLSVPAVFTSGLFEFASLISSIQSSGSNIIWTNLIIGIIFACVSGYFSIDFLLKYLQTHKTHIFVVYRIMLGLFILYLNYLGVVH